MKKKKTYTHPSGRFPKTAQVKEEQAVYLLTKPLKYIPEIRPAVFWDIPFENINYEKSRDFIICRVLNYGNFQEIADIIICYGRKYVKELALSTRNLNGFGLEAASAFLRIPEKQFACYELKQFPRSY